MNIVDICKDNGIRVCELTDDITRLLSGDPEKVDGWAVQFENDKIIYFNPDKGRWNSIYVVSHELAHFLFGHLSPDKIGNKPLR